MFCVKCGNEVPDDASFCVKCGAKLTPRDGGDRGRVSAAREGGAGFVAAGSGQGRTASAQAAPASGQERQPSQVPPAGGPYQAPAPGGSVTARGCFGSGWDDVRNSEGLPKRLAIMALIDLVPILNWVNTGYGWNWAKRLVQGSNEDMPDSIVNGDNFKLGFYLVVISVLLSVALSIEGFVLGMIPIIGAIAALALGVFAGMFANLSFARVAISERLGAAFDFNELFAGYKRNLGTLFCVSFAPTAAGYGIAILIGLVFSLIIGLVGGIDVLALATAQSSRYGYGAVSPGLGYALGGSLVAVLVLGLIATYLSMIVVRFFLLVEQRALAHFVVRFIPEWTGGALADAGSPAAAVPARSYAPQGSAPTSGGNAVGAASGDAAGAGWGASSSAGAASSPCVSVEPSATRRMPTVFDASQAGAAPTRPEPQAASVVEPIEPASSTAFRLASEPEPCEPEAASALMSEPAPEPEKPRKSGRTAQVTFVSSSQIRFEPGPELDRTMVIEPDATVDFFGDSPERPDPSSMFQAKSAPSTAFESAVVSQAGAAVSAEASGAQFEAAPAAKAEPQEPASAPLTLTRANGETFKPTAFPFVIGSEPHADWSIRDNPKVSRFHVRILRDGNTFLAEDLDSTNKTRIGVTRLDPYAPRPLSDGDELRLGNDETIRVSIAGA